MKFRLKNLLNYALDCIKRYKIRTIVILVCLTMAATLFSSVLFIKDGLVREGQLSLKYAPDLTVQGITTGRQSFIETRNIDLIQRILGVEKVVERIWGYGNIGNTLLVIVGIDPEEPNMNLDAAYPIESGSFLDSERNDTVVLGKAVAELIGAKVGNLLTIITESNQACQYTVIGIFNSESSIVNADTILMTKDSARSFFAVPEGKATDLMVFTQEVNPDYYQTQNSYVAREISELPNLRVLTKDLLANAQETTYGARSGFFSVVWYLVLISVAIVAFNQTVVVGHESRFEIGLLKALGFSTSDIIQIRLIEGTVLGFLAGSAGIVLGVFYNAVLNAPVLKDVMLGWATLYPAFPVPFSVNAQSIFLTYAITVIPVLFATVIPSWINATVDPDIAMRGARA
jgi:ABC-type lipoprotein release transport system permease subunit